MFIFIYMYIYNMIMIYSIIIDKQVVRYFSFIYDQKYLIIGITNIIIIYFVYYFFVIIYHHENFIKAINKSKGNELTINQFN